MASFADIRQEFRATARVALPLALANLAMMAMGFTDTVMVGRLGPESLAAAGLGAALYFTAGVALQGIVSAVAPLAAHAYGAGDTPTAGRVTGAGLVLALLLSLPFMVLVWWFDRVLIALGYDPVLAAAIGSFLRAVMWGTPAFLATAALRGLLSALGHQRAIMFVLIGGIGTNALFNWMLIFGNLGAPALGIVGSGYGTSINIWLGLLWTVLYIRAVPALAGLGILRGALSRPWGDIRRLLKIGLPIAGLMTLEAGLFAAAGLMIGLLGAAALGAHQIAMNIASITFMVPLGIAQAATVRVAHELGAGRPAVARIAGFLALALGVGFMLLAATLLWVFPRALIAVYVDADAAINRELVRIALGLLIVAAAFQVVDGAQVIAAGALRGLRDTTVPMLMAGVGYWGIGFLAGWLLAFPLGYGAIGLWCGMGIGLVTVAALLAWRFHRLTAVARLTSPATGHT